MDINVFIGAFLDKLVVNYRKLGWRLRTSPDFLIIGAQKSGTSSLFDWLAQHPYVQPPIHAKKEIHYFNGGTHFSYDNYSSGVRWYRANFPLNIRFAPENKFFEATPEYLYHPLVPQRIYDYNPKIKLIAVLRNPTERAISHYYHRREEFPDPLPILQAMEQEEERLSPVLAREDYKNELFVRRSYKARGRYAEQLKRYLQYFPWEQMLILNSEEMFSDPHRTLDKVFRFVGVDPALYEGGIKPKNVNKNKGNVDQKVYDYLNDYFRPHNEELYDLLGTRFNW